MPRLTLDLNDVKDFAPIEDGTPLPTKIAEIGEAKKASTGGYYVDVTFEVIDGEFLGRKLWKNYMLTGKGAGFTRQLYKAATGTDLEPGSSVDIDTDDLLGAHVTVIVENEDYNGEPRPRPGKVLPPKATAKTTTAAPADAAPKRRR